MIEPAILRTFEDYRRAMSGVVDQLTDEDILAELATERPYTRQVPGLTMYRVMCRAEAKRRGLLPLDTSVLGATLG